MSATTLETNVLVAQAYEQLKAGRSIDDVAGFLQESGIEPSAAYGIADAQVKLVQQEKVVPAAEPIAAVATLQTSGEPVKQPAIQPASPLVGALMMALRGVRQTPLQPRTKAAFKPSWEQSATTDAPQINAWATETSNCNWGSVATAQPGGIWIFDADNIDAIKQRIAETGHKFRELKTFQVRSSPKKGHSYFRHNGKSLALVNETGDKAYISIKADGKEIASARLNNAYVVSPGSVHPDTGLPYEIVNPADIVEAPEWLIEWIKGRHVVEKKLPVTASTEGPRVPRGSHDDELTRIAGKLRATGMNEDEIAPVLIRNVEVRFDDYGSDYKAMCKKVAHSIGKKPVVDTRVYHNGVPVDQMAEEKKAQCVPYETGQPIPPGYTVQASASGADRVEYLVKIDDEPEPDIDDSEVIDRPEFPRFVMEGTSLYENLVKPAIAASDKHPELIFMPAVLMFLNYISGRVHIKGHTRNPNLFLGIISPYGQFFKSSSCKVAQDYFKLMACVTDSSERAASGKTVIIAPGSTEGLGTSMKKISGDHAILYYDELSKLVDKAGIEHSSFCSDLLTFYDSGLFENVIKKESFSFPADTYCFSWLFCTTDRKFLPLWAKLPNADSGLNDRMFFMLSPQQPKPTHVLGPQPTFIDGALRTKQLIDKAFNHNNGNYEYEDWNDLQSRAAGLNPRAMEMLQDLALYFAIDLNLDVIDIDAAERALALVKYRNDVMAFLSPDEGENTQARLQMAMVRELQLHHGKMSYRELKNILHAARKGTDVWDRAINGLIHDKRVLLREARCGKAGEQRPAMVYLLKQQD